MSRQYIRRAAGFVHEGVFVQFNPYFVSQGVLGSDGLYGDAPFDSLEELAKVSEWSQPKMQEVVDKLKGLLS